MAGGAGFAKLAWNRYGKKAAKGMLNGVIGKEGRDQLVHNVVAGAAWGAGIGGVTAAANGDSFFGGVAGGAVKGGLVGVAGSALGGGARAFSPSAKGFKETGAVYSKQLQAVIRHRNNLKILGG